MSYKKGREIIKFWDRSRQLRVSNKNYADFAKKVISQKLKEDSADNDVTTNSLIDENKKIKAVIVANQEGIIAGIEEASLSGLGIKKLKNDGDRASKGDVILEIHDNARKILSYERTILNILQRMSGIATMSYNLKEIVKNNCLISGTRKTLLGLIDKRALSVGGALTHRLNLGDYMLIKDNHLRLLGNNIRNALEKANKNAAVRYIEIEVKNENEALEAAEIILKLNTNKLFAIMFDNMKASAIKDAIIKINDMIKINSNYKNNRYNNENLGKTIFFEASGGITKKNILEYSKTGVDIISLGALTHSAKAFDLSLETAIK